MTTRYFLRPVGMVIEETAFSLIAFQKMEDIKYTLDVSEQIANPIVTTVKGTQIRAIIRIVDPEVIQMINSDEEDEDEDEDDEVEEKPRRRGRPSKTKEEVKTLEPLSLSVVIFNEGVEEERRPLSECEPLLERIEKSEKNARVISNHLGRLAALVNKREEIYDNMEKESENISDELSSSVTDMIPNAASRIDVLQKSAVDDYRARQRRLESGIIDSIKEEYEFFQTKILDNSSFETDFEAFVEPITLGTETFTIEDMVKKFFKEELIKVG